MLVAVLIKVFFQSPYNAPSFGQTLAPLCFAQLCPENPVVGRAFLVKIYQFYAILSKKRSKSRYFVKKPSIFALNCQKNAYGAWRSLPPIVLKNSSHLRVSSMCTGQYVYNTRSNGPSRPGKFPLEPKVRRTFTFVRLII